MSELVSIGDRAPWLEDEVLQQLLAALSEGGEQARVAGGAIRDTLLGQPVTDIDVATTTTPDETLRRAEKAGFKVKPTGYEHGTVTVIKGGRAHEVTTLRADVETYGRHAKVKFGRDWQADAERRDFTINALYAEADGTVVDLVDGLADIGTRTLRFIGEPETRIREDYLRILRFFRFFAWYGAGRPDSAGLLACARLKTHIKGLSAERVWSELKKLLSAPDPSRALLWMRQTGVLSEILPESEKWGIDTIHALVKTEADLGWTVDPIRRLEAIVPPDERRLEKLAKRLRLSNAETERLVGWAETAPSQATATEGEFAKQLYRGEVAGFEDRLRLQLASARNRAASDDTAMTEAGGYARLLTFLRRWEKPALPIGGKDLATLGIESGPRMGNILASLEEDWVQSGFSMDRDALLRRAAELMNG